MIKSHLTAIYEKGKILADRNETMAEIGVPKQQWEKYGKLPSNTHF